MNYSFIFKKPQLHHLFLLVVGLIPLLSIYLTLSDIFRQSSDWLMINGLISFTCFLIAGGTFLAFLSKKQIDLIALFCAILCTSLFWLNLYFDRPEVRAEWIKNAYLTDYISYKSWEIHTDFLNEKIKDEILKDEVFIRQMMEKMSLDSSYEWQQVAKGIYQEKYKDYGLMLLLALRYQGKSDQQILEMPYSQELLLAVFFNELKPVYVGNNVAIPTWAKTLLRQKPAGIFKEGAVNQALWRALAPKISSQIENMGIFSCEIFLYLLTQIPTKMDESEFSKLMAHWIKLKPTYRTEILDLAEKRNKIYAIGQKISKNDTLFIDLQSYSSTNALSLIEPLVISAGFIPTLISENNLSNKNCLVFDFKSDVDLIHSEKVSIYEDVAKTRTKRSTGKYHITTTETYYEKKYKGSEQQDTYSYFYKIKFKTKENSFFTDSILTYDYLPHQYFDEQTKDYTIDYEQRARDEYWIYALPKKLYE